MTGNLTLEGWFKFTTVPATDGVMSLMGKWVDAGSQDQYLVQLQNPGGVQSIRFLNNDGTVGLATVGTSLTTGTWYHIAVSFNAATPQINVVIDGTSVGTASGTLRTSQINGTGAFIIGQDNTSSFLNGRVSLLRAWSTNLSAVTINANKCTVLGATANLQAEWTFDNTLNDNSGNSNTLTSSGSPTFAADVTATCAVAATSSRSFTLMGIGT